MRVRFACARTLLTHPNAPTTKNHNKTFALLSRWNHRHHHRYYCCCCCCCCFISVNIIKRARSIRSEKLCIETIFVHYTREFYCKLRKTIFSPMMYVRLRCEIWKTNGKKTQFKPNFGKLAIKICVLLCVLLTNALSAVSNMQEQRLLLFDYVLIIITTTCDF